MPGDETDSPAPTTKKCGLTELLVFCAALITGTACSVCSKVMMDMEGIGMTGQVEIFRKPLFQTFGMFIGMMFGLIMHYFVITFSIPFPGYNHNNNDKRKKKDDCFFSCCWFGNNNGDTQLFQPSPELAAIIGGENTGKSDAFQKVSEYIQYRELQQEGSNKIHCDEKLKRVVKNQDFVTKSTMKKYIEKHLFVTNGTTTSSVADETSSLLLSPNKFAQKQQEEEETTSSFWNMLFLLAIPSLLDLGATAFCMMGLRYLDVSLYQLLRGSGIIFVAYLKQFVLKNKLYNFQWVGVGWNVIAVILVGLTAVLGDDDDDDGSSDVTTTVSRVGGGGGSALVGVIFVLAGALVQAMQFVYEEHIMTSSGGNNLDAVPPLYLIGMEGFWGTFFCITILYPIAYYVPGDDHGSYENFINTWYMLMQTPSIQIMFGVYFIAIFGYNLFAILVTFLMNSIWHAILDNFRPITVWMVDLALFYLLAGSTFGASWDNPWSWLQLLGMIVLLYGTGIYNAPNDGSILLRHGTWYSFGMDFTKEYANIRQEKAEIQMDAEFESRMISKKRTNSSFMGERSPFLSKVSSMANNTKTTRSPVRTTTTTTDGGTFV